jgi:hypothetical protein
MDANTLLAILALRTATIAPHASRTQRTVIAVNAVVEAEPALAEKWLRIRDCEAHRESVIGLTQVAIDKHLEAGRTADVVRILRKCPMPPAP